jgi:hypothetical protein
MGIVDVHQNIEDFIVKYRYEHLVVIQILGKKEKNIEEYIYLFVFVVKMVELVLY